MDNDDKQLEISLSIEVFYTKIHTQTIVKDSNAIYLLIERRLTIRCRYVSVYSITLSVPQNKYSNIRKLHVQKSNKLLRLPITMLL